MSTRPIPGRDILPGLQQVCSRIFGADYKISDLRQLTGGASMETWSFERGVEQLILRRLPPGFEGADIEIPQIELEAETIELSRQNGVQCPEVLHILHPEEGLGRGYVMRRIDGEVAPKLIQKSEEFKMARERFVDDCAEALGRIHTIPLHLLPSGLKREDPKRALEDLWSEYRSFDGRSEIFSLAFSWLRKNVPEQTDLALVHGDFRLGNLMFNKRGLGAVLDWELVHIGDPVRDLAYLCSPAWRFENYDLPVAGLGDIDVLLQRYGDVCGRTVSEPRFRFWLVFCTLWWGISCLRMILRWRSGADRSLEKAVIGTRVREVEVDLLLVMEPETVPDEARIEWNGLRSGSRGFGTHFDELAQAISEWISIDVLPGTEERFRFQALVARNAINMLERELRCGEQVRDEQARRAAEMQIDRPIDFDAVFQADETGVRRLQHLRMTALENLAIVRPNYPAFRVALSRWAQEEVKD